MVYKFVVYGNPVPQGRAKAVKRGPFISFYDPYKSRKWKESVRWQVMACWQGKPPLHQPIFLTINFYLRRPKSLSKKIFFHTRKPDIDNLVKAIKDALCNLVYKDDRQVVKLYAEKLYSDFPRVEIILKILSLNLGGVWGGASGGACLIKKKLLESYSKGAKMAYFLIFKNIYQVIYILKWFLLCFWCLKSFSRKGVLVVLLLLYPYPIYASDLDIINYVISNSYYLKNIRNVSFLDKIKIEGKASVFTGTIGNSTDKGSVGLTISMPLLDRKEILEEERRTLEKIESVRIKVINTLSNIRKYQAQIIGLSNIIKEKKAIIEWMSKRVAVGVENLSSLNIAKLEVIKLESDILEYKYMLDVFTSSLLSLVVPEARDKLKSMLGGVL